MTLVSAFDAVCGPGSRGKVVPDEDARAALYDELQRLARIVLRGSERAEDAASEAFLKLVTGRVLTLNDSANESTVRSYLRRTIENIEKDRMRRHRRERPHDADLDIPDPAPSPDEHLDRATVAAELAAASEYLYSIVVPEIAAAMPAEYRAAFEEAVRQLRDIAAGQATARTIAQQQFGGVSKTAVDRLYQQHCRARKRLLDWIDDKLPARGLPPVRAKGVEVLVHQLQQRPRRGSK